MISSSSNIFSHDGVGLNVTWAHPKYNNIIATSGQDNKIKIWKESSEKKWEIIFEETMESVVNCIAFSPWEYGLTLAAGTASGLLYIITFSFHGDSLTWTKKQV